MKNAIFGLFLREVFPKAKRPAKSILICAVFIMFREIADRSNFGLRWIKLIMAGGGSSGESEVNSGLDEAGKRLTTRVWNVKLLPQPLVVWAMRTALSVFQSVRRGVKRLPQPSWWWFLLSSLALCASSCAQNSLPARLFSISIATMLCDAQYEKCLLPPESG